MSRDFLPAHPLADVIAIASPPPPPCVGSQASFSSQLQSIFLATLTVWLPLVPLFLIMRKVLDQRQGTRCVHATSVCLDQRRCVRSSGVRRRMASHLWEVSNHVRIKGASWRQWPAHSS